MPVTPTYDLIASNVLSSSASSVTFSSIPATYRDLIVVFNGSGTGNASGNMQFNGDTGTNYNYVLMAGDGSSTATTSETDRSNVLMFSYAYIGTTRKVLSVVQIMDYSATDKHKSVLVRSGESGSATEATAHRWANTAAINEISITASANQFASGSTFYLYGIVS